MLRALCLAITILLLPLNADFAYAGFDSDGNAALKYWQAFATLPTFNDAENKKLADALTTPLDDLARKILNDADYSLRMMHHAAALPRCDWGVSHEEGVFTRLPQANAARVLASLACMSARTHIEAGQSVEGIDDIVAGMTLGRHCSLAGTNIMLLSGYAIEHRMIELLALQLPKLDGKLIPDLKNRLAGLPVGMTVAEATVSEEQAYLDWFVRIVRKAKDKESLLAALAFIDNETEGKPATSGKKTLAFVEECGGSVESVLRFSEETRASYRRVAKLLALPIDQFEKEFEIESKKQASNPVFKIFFPAIVNVRKAQARMNVRRALLSAALAVRQDGPDALKNHSDPVVGGRFEYIPFDGGFELRSNLKGRDDKPVTLMVGQHG
jgi:alkylhydroperoxidase family enzyme